MRSPRAFLRARSQARGDKAIEDLKAALGQLGIDEAIPEPLERGLRHYTRYEVRLAAASIVALWVAGLWSAAAFGLLVRAGTAVAATATNLSTPSLASVEKLWNERGPESFWIASLMLAGAMALAALVLFLIASSGFFISSMLSGSPTAYRILGTRKGWYPALIYRPVYHATQVIVKCGRAIREHGEEKVIKVGEVPTVSAQARDDIQKAHRLRGTIAPFGRRKKVIRDHTARVAARLQEIEDDLFRTPDDALRMLATSWLSIAERYAEGRIGALLDDDLSTVEPARTRIRDRLRDALAVALTVGTVFFTASLELPQAIEGYVIAGSAVAVLILVYGSKAVLDRRVR
ncbi:hypothetical protein GCM10010222_02140 [Streptomyces tanashiensis]|uniref:hypothetical protein n=1 Tax=Streptomyces tanashiensis TaxID=67367 RepID=UPI00167BCFD7|nr:hypothetical protein [Streptomyces tanashiensis]GGS65440.1 hypothetical protein GCM10010222_02140 [Streptomyces tanashiensis]